MSHITQPVPKKRLRLAENWTCDPPGRSEKIFRTFAGSNVLRARSLPYSPGNTNASAILTARPTSAQPTSRLFIPDLLTTRSEDPAWPQRTPPNLCRDQRSAQMFSRLAGLRGRRTAGKSDPRKLPAHAYQSHVCERRIVHNDQRVTRRRTYRTRRHHARRRRVERTVISSMSKQEKKREKPNILLVVLAQASRVAP
jgi:hypothetical protein